MGSIDAPSFIRDKMKKSQTTSDSTDEVNSIDAPEFLKKNESLQNGGTNLKNGTSDISPLLSNSESQSGASNFGQFDVFNNPLNVQAKPTVNVSGIPVKIEEDLTAPIPFSDNYNSHALAKELQDRIDSKTYSEDDVNTIAGSMKVSPKAATAYMRGDIGTGTVIHFNDVKEKQQDQLKSIITKANQELNLNDSYESNFATPEMAGAYISKIQNLYNDKAQKEIELESGKSSMNYITSGASGSGTAPILSEATDIRETNLNAAQQLKAIVTNDIIDKVSSDATLTKDQKVAKIYQLSDGRDQKNVDAAMSERLARAKEFGWDGISGNTNSVIELLNANKAGYEYKLNKTLDDNLTYNKALKNSKIEEYNAKVESGEIKANDPDAKKVYTDQIAKIDVDNANIAKQIVTDKELFAKYPTLQKAALASAVNEYNAIQSGNVQGYEDGGYKDVSLPEYLAAHGFDIKDQKVQDFVRGDNFKDYTFFGRPLQNALDVFISSGKALGDVTGIRDDATLLAEKKGSEIFPTAPSENDEFKLTEAAKIGQNIGSTTGQVIGQGLLQAGTAGLGRMAGLSKLAATNAAFWTSGSLTSYDQAYKDSYDFIDTGIGRTAYAGLIALSNAASERIFPDIKLFQIPGVTDAIADLSKKIGTKEFTNELAEVALGKVKNSLIAYGKEFGKDVGKETVEEVSTQLFEDGLRYISGDPKASFATAIENAKNTAIQTATGMLAIGAYGAHKTVQEEKNTAPKATIYNAALYHDDAVDAINKGYEQKLYSEDERNEKIKTLNTAQKAIQTLAVTEKVTGTTLPRPKKELYVANLTAEALLTEQMTNSEDVLVQNSLGEKISNLQSQRKQLLDGKVSIDDDGNISVPNIAVEKIEQQRNFQLASIEESGEDSVLGEGRWTTTKEKGSKYIDESINAASKEEAIKQINAKFDDQLNSIKNKKNETEINNKTTAATKSGDVKTQDIAAQSTSTETNQEVLNKISPPKRTINATQISAEGQQQTDSQQSGEQQHPPVDGGQQIQSTEGKTEQGPDNSNSNIGSQEKSAKPKIRIPAIVAKIKSASNDVKIPVIKQAIINGTESDINDVLKEVSDQWHDEGTRAQTERDYGKTITDAAIAMFPQESKASLSTEPSTVKSEEVLPFNFENKDAIETGISEKYKGQKNIVFHGSPDISYLNGTSDFNSLDNTKNAESKYVNVSASPRTAVAYAKSYNGYGENSGVASFELKGKKYVMKKSDIQDLKNNEQYEAFYDKKKTEGYDYIEVPQDANNIVVLNNDALSFKGKDYNKSFIQKSENKPIQNEPATGKVNEPIPANAEQSKGQGTEAGLPSSTESNSGTGATATVAVPGKPARKLEVKPVIKHAKTEEPVLYETDNGQVIRETKLTGANNLVKLDYKDGTSDYLRQSQLESRKLSEAQIATKNKNNEDKKQSAQPNKTESNPDNSQEAGKKKRKRVKGTRKANRQIKHPAQLQALSHEVTTPLDRVLQYFIAGGKVNASAMESIFGNKRGKSVNAETISRVDLLDKTAPSLSEVAHKLWDNLSEQMQSKYDSQDFENAVEGVLIDFTSRTKMAESLNNRLGEENNEEDKDYIDYLNQTYDQTGDEEATNDAIDIVEPLTDEEAQRIVDEEKEGQEVYFNQLIAQHEAARAVISQQQAEKDALGKQVDELKTYLDKLQNRYDKGKATLDKNGQQDQGDIFGGKPSDELLFKNDLSEQRRIVAEAKTHLDNVKELYKEAKERHDNFAVGSMPMFSTKEDANDFETKDSRPATLDLLQKTYPDATIVQSQSDLPQEILDEVPEGKTVEGVLHNGKIYMVADNLDDMGRAEGVYKHESIGHSGVIAELKNKLDKFANDLVNNASAQQKAAINKLSQKKFNKNSDQLTPEEKSQLGQEYIAQAAEKPQNYPTTIQKIVSFVRGVLRDLGIKISVSEKDIKVLLGRAANQRSNTIGTRFSIVGEKANLAKNVRDNLEVAREMENSGKHASEIHWATGWERGKDEKWRYEIPDVILDTSKISKSGDLELKDIIKPNSDLIKAYPELTNTVISFVPNLNANADYKHKEYFFNEKTELYEPRHIIRLNTDLLLNEDKLRSALVHEIQHGIQQIEGFAPGGSPSQFETNPNRNYEVEADKEVQNLENEIDQLVESGNTIEKLESLGKTRDQLNVEIKELLNELEELKIKKYKSIAGEVEARNVQTRLNYPENVRKSMPFSETEDVAREDQTLYFGAGVQQSVADDDFAKHMRDMLRVARSSAQHEEIKPEDEKLLNDYIAYVKDGKPDTTAQDVIDAIEADPDFMVRDSEKQSFYEHIKSQFGNQQQQGQQQAAPEPDQAKTKLTDTDIGVINDVLNKKISEVEFPHQFAMNAQLTQIAAGTQSRGQEERQVLDGSYVQAHLADLRSISEINSRILADSLGKNWKEKLVQFLEDKPTAGRPEQVAGLLNVMSTQVFQDIANSKNGTKISELKDLQARIDSIAYDNARSASLVLNQRRLYQDFAQGKSVNDILSEVILTPEQQQMKQAVEEALKQKFSDEELNKPKASIPKTKTPKATTTPKTTATKSNTVKDDLIAKGKAIAQSDTLAEKLQKAKDALNGFKC